MEQLRGVLANGTVILTEDGLPVITSDAPEAEPGYEAVGSWEQTGNVIRRVWKLSPIEGTPEKASVRLAEKLVKSLPDDEAAGFSALFPEWMVVGRYYVGDRYRRLGKLYKCLKEHDADALPTVQSDEATDATQAPVVPGESPAYWQLLGPKS